MKTVLDRLLARQRHLLDKLDSPAREPATLPVRKRMPSEAELAAEADALQSAQQHLESGDMQAAKALLQPFAGTANQVRTLTMLSRIASAEGAFDEALALLKRAEALSPSDPKIWRLLAEACGVLNRHQEEVHYRRKLAFVDPHAPTHAFLALARALQRATPRGKTPNKSEMRLAAKKMLSAPDVNDEHRLKMAETLYAAGAAAQARADYAAVAPCRPGERDVTARWVRMIDWCEQSSSALIRQTAGGVPGHRPMIGELRDAWVFPRFQWIPVVDAGKVVLSGFTMQRLKLRSEDPGAPILMNSDGKAELRVPDRLPIVDAPALLIGGSVSYYHNTIEFLSALAIAEALGKGADLPLVINDDLAPFQVEQLALLGYSEQRLIKVAADQPLCFRQLLVPSRLVQAGRWMDPLLPSWYRQRLGLKAPHGATRRLYLSRSETTRRRIVNEEELVRLLLAHGYEVACPERLGVREQVDLFSQASHIVAPTGAALANMIFAPPGATVIAFYTRHYAKGGGDVYFDALAAACGHRFISIECLPPRVEQGQRVIDADILVELDELRRQLG